MFRFLVSGLASILVVGAWLPIGAATTPSNTRHLDHRGTPKLLFAPEFRAAGLTDPVAIAGAYLEANRDLFRLPDTASDLVVERVRRSLLGTHVRYQQYLNGIPVETAEIIVSVGTDGRILKVFNNVYPVIRQPEATHAMLSADQAIDAAWADLGVRGELLDMLPTARLVYKPQGLGFRLVYLTQIDVADPYGCWQYAIDAVTEQVVDMARVDVPLKGASWSKPEVKRSGATTLDRRTAERDFLARQEAAAAAAPAGDRTVTDGTGQVFDPDPKTTLQNQALLDTSPASTFDPAYFTRTLSDIDLTAGTYSLDGPWVTIVDFETPTTPPSTTTDGNWTAVRGNNAFNDSNTYFQIDQNQRYIQGLGFTGGTGIQEGPIETDTDGYQGTDNSHYFPGTNQLGFGHGGVDDDEDVDVILHEYMHGLTHDINSSWSGGDTGAMGEGFGDYWGGSYSYSTPNGPTFHPSWAFSWDGHGTDTWPGRVMDLDPGSNQYDPSCTYPAHSSCGGVDGDMLWSSPNFQAFLDLIGLGRTREEIDTIILESQFGLGSGLKMPDMASAIVAAAGLLYPTGPHADAFQTEFSNYNILNLPTVAAPTFTYPTSASVVPAGGSVDVTWDTAGAPGTTEYSLEYTAQCTPTQMFGDDMESGGGAWSVSHDTGAADWSLQTSSPHSGTTSWFASEPSSVADQYLTFASPVVVPAGAQLSFWHSYDIENGFDGGVVEISTNSGSTWTDLGNLMSTNGYDSTISSSWGSPIGGRSAFTGDSGGYIQTVVDLASYAASSVLIRFRMATDSGVSAAGWWVDDVSISQTGSWATVGTSSPGASSMPWTAPAVPGTDYCMKVTATAPGYSPSVAQSDIFEVGLSDNIFADDFETGTMSAWSIHVP